MGQWHSVPYRDAVEVLPGVRVTFLEWTHFRIGVCAYRGGWKTRGDDERRRREMMTCRVTPPTDAPKRQSLDLVVCESALPLSDRLHSPTPRSTRKAQDVCDARRWSRESVLMIPAFFGQRRRIPYLISIFLWERDGVTLDRCLSRLTTWHWRDAFVRKIPQRT